MPSKPLPVLPGTYYSIVKGQWNGRPSNNVFCFTVSAAPASGAPDVTAASAIASAIASHWPAFALIAHTVHYEANSVYVYPLNTPVHPAVEQGMTAPGGKDEALTAAQACAVIRHSVTRRGRGTQTATHISPLGNALIQADGITLLGAYVSDLDTAFTAFITGVKTDAAAAIGAGSVNYVQLSKGTDSGTPPVHVPAATYPITASAAEPIVGTLRRRTQRN